jgi:hypothetical protein
MRLVTCQLVEASLQYKEFSRGLGKGAVVDLDEVVGKRTVEDEHGTREEDVILEDLLKGDDAHPGLLHAFEPVVEESSPATPAQHVDELAAAHHEEPAAEPHVE